MGKKSSLVGRRFGKLLVIAQRYEGSLGICLVLCDCKNTKEVRRSDLNKRNGTKSCGCLVKEINSKMRLTHGLSRTKEYRSWYDMKGRCLDPTTNDYKYYGARGITICDEWLIFENFYADMGLCPLGLTLDRVDNNKSYFKDNCIWATRSEQAQNRRPKYSVFPK